jgi:pimeloyl-ACP methyl ester carboxylesterase
VSISTLEVSVRGVRSPVLTAGPRDGAEAVVFVHGNPGPADDWRELLTRAGELGRAVAPDMPGYGRAGQPKDFSYSVDGYASRPAFRMLLGRENPRLTRDQIDRIYDASRSRVTKRAVLKLYRATPAAKLADLAPALRPLDRPALVIWGTKDAYLPREQAERQRQSFPSARVELLEGGGHWVMLEDPERVASLVIPFLMRQLPGPAAGSPASSSPSS